jgi:DNA-directed RNA polymerase III subunit RPC1
MSVKHNLVSPRNGEPVIAAIQDFITASYLISQKDQFFDRRQFTQICSYFADANLQVDIPPPTIWKPVRLWTGKQVFNVLMRPNKQSKILVNVETKCNKPQNPRPDAYSPRMKPLPDLSPNDGWLVIQNSEIMCGLMDKATVGSGKKKSIFGVILRDYGPHEAALAMNRVAKLCARWLGAFICKSLFLPLPSLIPVVANYGFSLGINDVIPGPILASQKDALVEKAYAQCLDLIALAKKGKLENKAGCNQEQTLEAMISSVLSKVRDEVGEICMKELSKYNAPLIMATCGSKGKSYKSLSETRISHCLLSGSVINVAQMTACVGQQIIGGRRVPDGFQDRSLPHFPKKSREPPSKGFVRNSFYSGLTPTEFLFHAISGREGLVDTAVKTAETGYMQRRLMKALEDLTTHYDLTVRNATGGIVQFRYGDDGLDPACLEGDAQPIDLERSWRHAVVRICQYLVKYET